MSQVVNIKSEKLFPLINEIIKQGEKVRLTVTGMSMYPFLREGIDSVELKLICFSDIKCGDIVIILRNNGQYIMHRVIRRDTSCFYIIGDAQQWIEGPVYPNQLVAGITAVWRENKRIDVESLLWRLPSKLWLRLIPFRQIIIKIYRRLGYIHRCFE